MKKSEIKKLIKEILDEDLKEAHFASPSNQAGEGYATARSDDAKGIERPLDPRYYTPDFIKGYTKYKKDVRWQKWSDKLTKIASNAGQFFQDINWNKK